MKLRIILIFVLLTWVFILFIVKKNMNSFFQGEVGLW